MVDLREELARILSEIEAADGSIVSALDRRAAAVRALLALRERDPDGYYMLPRYPEVVDAASGKAPDFPAESLRAIFREVVNACDSLLSPMTVAYVGTEGSFAHVAASRSFGSAASCLGVATVSEALEQVVRGRASTAVVPLETSTDGAVTATLNGLLAYDVRIMAELTLPASYYLLSVTGNVSDVEKIYGAPQAVAACERFLREHFPRATVLDVPSGEIAAQFAREDHGAAAVATDVMMELHELRRVHERIEDVTGVETRFAVVGNELPPRSGNDRTVLAMAVSDSPGGLHRSLLPFAERGINLTRLESRPAHGTAFRHVFFVELDGHVTDRPVLTAIEELRALSRMVKILGSYPKPT